MFSSLPKDLGNIIMDYIYQLEHVEKFKESLNKINNIEYEYYENEEGLKLSRRFIGEGCILNETIEYYHQLSYKNNFQGYHFLNIEHRFNYSAPSANPWAMNNIKILYAQIAHVVSHSIKMKRAHYEKKYRLEDCGYYAE